MTHRHIPIYKTHTQNLLNELPFNYSKQLKMQHLQQWWSTSAISWVIHYYMQNAVLSTDYRIGICLEGWYTK